jgi:hypothetical protein
MKQRDRPRKRRIVIAFAILVTIISLLSCIGYILLLEPLVHFMERHGSPISLLETVIIRLRPAIWLGLIASPIVGWKYAQGELSGRLAVGILSIIGIVEIGYLVVEVLAGAALGLAHALTSS